MFSILITFWFIFIWVVVIYLRQSSVHPSYFFEHSFKNFGTASATKYSHLERLGRIRFISTPGVIVNRLSNGKKVKSVLVILDYPISLRAFLGIKQVILTFFLIYFWLYIWFGELSWKNTGLFFMLLGLSFYIPNLWLQSQKERYLRQIAEEVPYFIDLLSLSLQTGMNIQQALIHTASHKKGLMASKIARQCEQLKLGRSIEDLLSELKEILPNPEFDHFLTHVLRAKKLGVSLADTLEIQSKILRTKRRQMAEELSRTAAVKISLPLVLFIFPALLIIYIGPGLLHLTQH